MASEMIEAYRGTSHAVAEQIAPTWERRRGDVEEVMTPVRAWMIRQLRPHVTPSGYEIPDVALRAVAR